MHFLMAKTFFQITLRVSFLVQSICFLALSKNRRNKLSFNFKIIIILICNMNHFGFSEPSGHLLVSVILVVGMIFVDMAAVGMQAVAVGVDKTAVVGVDKAADIQVVADMFVNLKAGSVICLTETDRLADWFH